MAVPSISPGAWQISDDSIWSSLLPAIQNGLKVGMSIPQNMADLQYKQAQAQREQAMANLPFGGQTLPGPAGQVLGLETMRQMFGEQSPQYQMAMQSFNLAQQSDQSRINYQNVLSNTLPVRALTPTGKDIMEQTNVSQGLSPTGQPFTGQAPGTPSQLGGVYDLLRQKNVTDTDTRKRNLYATNIEKTLDRIDPDTLTQYAGISGGLSKLGQSGLAALGKESPEYDKYSTALKDVDFLASQVRQFYGDSIQPSVRDSLKSLANPSTWMNNPQLAQSQFNETKKVLQNEMQTYRDALKGTQVYQGQSQQLPLSNVQVQALQSALGGQAPAMQSAQQQGQAQPQMSAKAAQLMQMAQKAIASGKDPELVKQRMQQLMAGGR
jgi:hypothetical protein